MNFDALQTVLGLCALINYGVLIAWFLCFWLAHERLHRLHGRWFQLTPDQFDAMHYLGMAIYKILILVFNLVPWIALKVLPSLAEVA